MIRLICMLRRKQGMTHEEFEHHWRTRHGPLIASIPAVRDRQVRYEQHPRLHAPGRFTGTSGFDGVAIVTFESMDDFEAMIADPAYEPVREDEQRFLDLDGTVIVVADEPRVVLG